MSYKYKHWLLQKVKFYKHLFLSANSMLYNVFNFAMVHNYFSDDKLRTVFMPQCLAVDLIYHLFEDYVGYSVYVYFIFISIFLSFSFIVILFFNVLMLSSCE